MNSKTKLELELLKVRYAFWKFVIGTIVVAVLALADRVPDYFPRVPKVSVAQANSVKPHGETKRVDEANDSAPVNKAVVRRKS
jgi:hypothetical protein